MAISGRDNQKHVKLYQDYFYTCKANTGFLTNGVQLYQNETTLDFRGPCRVLVGFLFGYYWASGT